ncbi:MAG: ABC transporter ATP-binding protein [Deltaproteobacteria bacterium]|nr:ABC transporter ATP-binding protein [Deltaproteobacteria bacterium]
MSYIVAENIAKQYGAGASAAYAVAGVSLEIEAGSFVGIMGESGAGKSTLLSVLGAMNSPTSGRYLVDGIDVYALGTERQADFRREYLGFVFQSFHLVPYLSVLENVMLPLTTARIGSREKKRMAMEALDWVGIEQLAGRLPGGISGGEKERVAVARAIVNDPPVLLADEPTGNLDNRNTLEVMKLLERLNRAGTTIVMVTHSLECARFAGRILRLFDGRVQEGEDPGENARTGIGPLPRRCTVDPSLRPASVE